MKLWIDDVRPAPDGWFWAHNVHEAMMAINVYEHNMTDDQIILSLDHDAGDEYEHGGDFINVLKMLEAANIVDTGYSFHLHTMNVVGRDNMRAIIQRNGWKEV